MRTSVDPNQPEPGHRAALSGISQDIRHTLRGLTAIEIFYVIEGVLGHVVNGEEHRIEPGMVGVVKPGDEVVHRVVGSGPVRALVIWVPGGEGDRIASPERWSRIGG